MPMVHAGSMATSWCCRAPRLLGLAQHDGTADVDTVQGKHVLGEIDSSVQNVHGPPLSSELMMKERLHFPSWHSLPASASRRARDGEISFIR